MKFAYRNRVMGHGLTDDEAEKDLAFNLAKFELPEFYQKRRHFIYSWLPTRDRIAVKGKFCIKHKDGMLIDEHTNESVAFDGSPYSQYRTLYYLVGRYMNFADFTLTIGQEVDEFFENIQSGSPKLKDFPYIFPSTTLDVKSLHYLECGGFVGVKDDIYYASNGKVIKFVQMTNDIPKDNLLCYLLASLGICTNLIKCYKQ